MKKFYQPVVETTFPIHLLGRDSISRVQKVDAPIYFDNHVEQTYMELLTGQQFTEAINLDDVPKYVPASFTCIDWLDSESHA